jgi:cytochrome c-type biogenesis protein
VIDAPLAYAFGVGMVATVNPCGFAMLPAYLSFFLGLEEADADTRGSVLHALVIGATVTAGFLVVFGTLGILLDGALSSLQDWLPWVTIVLGILLVGLGIALLAGRSFAFRIPTPRQRHDDSQLLSVFVFGVSYALVSLSCTIPLFIAAVAPSFADANFASGVAAFLAYGLGMGVVLIALTVALALAKHSLVRNLRRVLPYVYKVSGVLLVVAGAYVAYYGWYEMRVRGGDTSAGGAAQLVFDWNESISNWVQDVGPVRLGIVLAAAVGVVIALTMGARRRPDDPAEPRSRPVDHDSE